MKDGLLVMMICSFVGIAALEAVEGNWKIAIGSLLLAGANGVLLS